MLTKTNSRPSSTTSATLNPRAEWLKRKEATRSRLKGSETEESGEQEEGHHHQATWSLNHQVNAASVSSEFNKDDSRALILWTAGDSLQILLTQQQRRRHRELTSSFDGSRSTERKDNENASLGLSAVASCGRPYALSLVLATLKGKSLQN